MSKQNMGQILFLYFSLSGVYFTKYFKKKTNDKARKNLKSQRES